MPMEKVEFSFPDPEKDTSKDVVSNEDGTVEIIVEGRADPFRDVPNKDEAKDDLQIEVVDDTPPKDRGRKPSAPPEELTDEELESYSDKVRKRIQHFSKGYHDQRRAAEQAAREKAELESMATHLLEENRKLRGTVGENQQALLEQAKNVAARELKEAKAKFKEAYDAGEAEALADAQEAMTEAKIRVDRANNVKIPPLQEKEIPVKDEPNTPVVDTRAQDWQKANPWFGQDDEMTSFALGLHQKLVKQGVDPRSDDYYEKINSRMRQVFSDQFDDEEEAPRPRRKSNVVAPATRSTAPKKIVLTQTQVALARRMGVPLEEYARQVAIEMRKQNG